MAYFRYITNLMSGRVTQVMTRDCYGTVKYHPSCRANADLQN